MDVTWLVELRDEVYIYLRSEHEKFQCDEGTILNDSKSRLNSYEEKAKTEKVEDKVFK